MKTVMGFRRKEVREEDDIDFRKIIHSIKPLFIIGKCFGIFRFRIKNNELLPTDGKIKCFVICLVGVFIGGCVAAGDHSQHSLIGLFHNINTNIVYLSYVITLVINSITKSNANVQIIKYLTMLHSKFKLCPGHGFYRRSRNYLLLVILLIFSTNIFFVGWICLTFPITVIRNMIIEILLIVREVETALACTMIYMLNVSLEIINKHLGMLTRSRESMRQISVPFTFHSSTRISDHMNLVDFTCAKKLRNLSRAYVIIGKTCSAINSLFNFQMLLVIVDTFLSTLTTISMLIYAIRSGVFILPQMWFIFIWYCWKLASVIAFSFMCEMLLRTRSKTKELVNVLVMDYKRPDARAHAKALARIIDAWPLQISVYDLFRVDISMLFKFISVATSYYIILLQIERCKYSMC